MKKLLALALLMSAISLKYVSADVTGRSFYQPLSVGSQHELLMAGNNWYAHNQKPKRHDFSVGVNTFFQASVGGKHLSNYFFPAGKRELQIRGANSQLAGCDVSGTWLQIVGQNSRDSLSGLSGASDEMLLKNEYSSSITVNPKFRLFGATPLATYWHKIKGMPFFVSVGLPVGKMHTNMHLKESNITNEVATFTAVDEFQTTGNALWEVTDEFSRSAIESLNNPNKQYGKISNHAMSVTGMGDLFVDLGLQIRNNIQAGLRFELPTSAKASGEYMFQPVLGNNGRGAMHAYAQAYYQVLEREAFDVTLNGRAELGLVMRGDSMRTYDLKEYGAWSRYLLLIDAKRAHFNPSSAVNYTTLSTRVGLMPQGDLNLGARLHRKNWTVAANYNLTVRGAERLTLLQSIPERVFVVSELSPAASPQGTYVNDYANDPKTIATHADVFLGGATTAVSPDDIANAGRAITNTNLDVTSGAMPQYLANQFSLQGGYECMLGGRQADFSLGTNYSFVRGGSHSNMYAFFGSISIKI